MEGSGSRGCARSRQGWGAPGRAVRSLPLPATACTDPCLLQGTCNIALYCPRGECTPGISQYFTKSYPKAKYLQFSTLKALHRTSLAKVRGTLCTGAILAHFFYPDRVGILFMPHILHGIYLRTLLMPHIFHGTHADELSKHFY
ncbi:hypothetical protein NDU88_005063 [Pleurodeles waltl]|uniref:Uncharacterized protein n=1 Tax=Pleurodeles waltl TaxID=8319 RepID=A0AAV7N063_PLEWA|nr:hypothetical protein NDU88_005063 [Pleurodeles waltl]